MKHAILGAGAIGGLMGTALAALGEDVSMIVRREKLSRHPREITLDRPSDSLTASVNVVSELSEPTDVLWIATKTYHLENALQSIHSEARTVVPLLNGVEHIAVLRSRFGQDRVVPATIAVEAERAADGHFIQRSPVRLNIAAIGEPILAETAAGLRNLGFLCSFIANERSLLWGKLCFLGPFALVTSASGKDLGGIMADPQWKAALNDALAEARTVAEAHGAQIDNSRIQTMLDSSPPTMRSSMAKDLAAGRELELDGIAGPILRGGPRFGIPVPTTSRLAAEINALATASRKR
jgi:2-dehydropantoate 2-reductase